MPFEHAPPEPARGTLLKAGGKSPFGFGGGFRKRIVVVDAEGILKYYDKDPAKVSLSSTPVEENSVSSTRDT